MKFHKHSEYLQAYHALVNELERPDFNSSDLDGLLDDFGAALCMGHKEEDDFEPPYPTLLDYFDLVALLADRHEKLTILQRNSARDRLQEMLELMTAE